MSARTSAGHRTVAFARVGSDGRRSTVVRSVAEEVAVAIEYDGVGYAVLMATSEDLEDLAYGFSLAERLIDGVDDILGIDCHETDGGIIVRVALHEAVKQRVGLRVRHRASDSSCGLCGIENLEQALRALPLITARTCATEDAIFQAYAKLPTYQRLNGETGAVHAAAACSPEGEPLLVREDVGRHNAFDKLIGAMLRSRMRWDGGFALLSSRCSFELVEKAVLAGCPMLATISAPSTLALDRADAAGLSLRVLVRGDALLAPQS